MKDLSNSSAAVSVAVVDAGQAEQRVDNFLLRVCKGVPRSHVYRILRSGEVRVNSRRVDATYRLKEGDRIRIPPIRIAARTGPAARPAEFPIVLEDEALLVINKPSGVAVHGGSGVSYGVIESLRASRPQLKFLELVHRLDRETSGLLVLAKKRSALTALHADLREGRVYKRYLALVHGRWKEAGRSITLPLRKFVNKSGERRVSVDRVEGMASRTDFRLERSIGDYSLLSAILRTGRTHQIRVHLSHLGYPIAGDDKYGNFELNRALAKLKLSRMFLHAAELRVRHPVSGMELQLEAPLPAQLTDFLRLLEKKA
jgi:23S rRNA pseudouridine955/2504/2580 synthase